MMSAWLFVVFALLSGVAFHYLAAIRSGGDCGGFWAQALDRFCLYFCVPLLVVSTLHSLTFAKNWLPAGSGWWLLITGAACMWCLVAGVVSPASPDSGRWIAGTLEFSPHRHWVLLFFLPFLVILFYTTPPWLDGIYAAHWGVVVVFFMMLLGLAFSASPKNVWTGTTQRTQVQPGALSPWPDEMERRGVSLRQIADWEPSLPAAPSSELEALWLERLTLAGSEGVSSVLCGAVSSLVSALRTSQNRVATVLAPDQCGQEEVVAMAATELSRRYGEATLVITGWENPDVAENLHFWLGRIGGERPARLLDLTSDLLENASSQADLLVTDAETLSDFVLDQLRSEIERSGTSAPHGLGLSRIGLVVWWNVHEFSGVLAAHVWAVSRRLERLLRTRRGAPSRALVLARRPREREVAFLAFLAHLLPYEQTKDNQFQIAPRFARRTFLYQLQDRTPIGVTTATESSLLTDWPTFPAGRSYGSSPTGRKLAQSAPAAGARLVDLRADEVLSLREIICQGGRNTPAGINHYVAIAASDNPYINFLVSRYQDEVDAGASVNLVGAEGHAELVRRHLLLGLREVPDTLTGLRGDFRWEETMLRNALRTLDQEGRLRSFPVRFLLDGRLQRDSFYANQNPGQGAIRSFRMIGLQRSVELRDPNMRNRLLMQVDPERLPIDAYPKKVFENLGHFYRVQGWSGIPSRVECLPEDRHIKTWPFSTSRVAAIRPSEDSLTFSGVERYPARVHYSEDVSGVWERDASGTFRTIGINPVVRTNFDTEALMLDFRERFSLDQLVCAAAVMQHIVPVHTAIAEDALKIVPVFGDNKARLAFVDLYPGGVGVVKALHKSTWLMATLFDHVVIWLTSLKDTQVIQETVRSPIFRTRNIDQLDVRGVMDVFTSGAVQPR